MVLTIRGLGTMNLSHRRNVLFMALCLLLNLSGCSTDEGTVQGEGGFAPYPTVDWAEASPEDVGMDRSRLQELQEYFEHYVPDSLLVARKGYIVLEKYYGGHSKETVFETFSVTKSFTSAVAGIAIAEGLFGVDQPAADFITSWKSPDPRSTIRIRDLLTMTSGLRWSFSEYVHIGLSLPIGPLTEDLLKHSLDLPLDHTPGSQWTYNNCATMALCHVFSSTSGMGLMEYARDRLFEPIGMHSATWLADGTGHTYTFMGLRATVRDLTRFGYLFLRGGLWEGRQIIPQDWVGVTTQPYSDLNPAYGYLWWVNGYADAWGPMEGQLTLHIPKTGYFFGDVAPPDSYAALGAFGQMIAVIPELDLVMVRNGGSELYDFKQVFTLLYKTVANGAHMP